MRTLTFLIVLVAALICQNYSQYAYSKETPYTYWQRWHNIPTPWTQNTFTNLTADPNTTSNLTNWVRNVPGNTHYSGRFNDFSYIRSQNLYWRKSDPKQVLFCRPKYYLYSDNYNKQGYFMGLCKKNPYYWSSQSPQTCVPHTYGIVNGPGACSSAWPFLNSQDCCFKNNYDPSQLMFENNFDSRDTVLAPLI